MTDFSLQKNRTIFNYLFITSQMPSSLDFTRLCGVLDYGRYSYNFSKVFMFSLSKVVNKVVKHISTIYAEMRSASCLGKSVIRAVPIILSNSSLADSYVACV